MVVSVRAYLYRKEKLPSPVLSSSSLLLFFSLSSHNYTDTNKLPPTSHLEPQLGKEPPVLPALELLLQNTLGLLVRCCPARPVLQALARNHILQVRIQRIPRRHQMLIVHHLRKRLQTRPTPLLHRRLLLRHLTRLLRQPTHQRVPIRTRPMPIIVVLHNHSLLPACLPDNRITTLPVYTYHEKRTNGA